MSDKPTPAPRAQRAITATWRLLVLLAVIAAIGLVLAHSLRVYFVQRAEIADLKVQIAQEQSNIADLNDQLERWNDPEYVRAIARERLGWVMPGEVGYHVLGADGKPLDGATIDAGEDEDAGTWWERMWGSVQVADQLAEEESAAEAPDPDRTIEPSPAPSTEDENE